MATYNNFTYVHFQHEEILRDPKSATKKLCTTLGLTCYPEFQDGVARGLFEKPNLARNGIDWTEDRIERVEKIVKKHPKMFTMLKYTKLDSKI